MAETNKFQCLSVLSSVLQALLGSNGQAEEADRCKDAQRTLQHVCCCAQQSGELACVALRSFPCRVCSPRKIGCRVRILKNQLQRQPADAQGKTPSSSASREVLEPFCSP